ncbi:GNAT family N-acetyltransferase [Stackebrandtia albiflava]
MALRAAYDAQIRTRMTVHDPERETVETVGPIRRKTVAGARGYITYRDLDGLSGDDLDSFIAAQRDHYAAIGASVEWKYHSYDLPEDLPERLTAAGFVAEQPETLALGEAADLAIAPRTPEGATLREISAPADLERVRLLEEAVWNTDHGWLPEALAAEISSDTDPVVVIAAEHGEDLVCAAWIRFHNGTEFAGLWGGSTMPEWRGRGVYRAVVARRAQLALARGFGMLQVDSSPDSAPILERLGMVPVATTVPYVWRPSTEVAGG